MKTLIITLMLAGLFPAFASAQSGDSCGNAFAAAYLWEQNLENYGPCYDTMKWYISHCYKNASGDTWGGFGGSLDSVIRTPAGRQDIFNFVLHALTLRNDDGWFCTAVPYLGVEYNTGDGFNTVNYRAGRAIMQFLIQNPRCAYNHTNDSEEYAGLLYGQYSLWSDTAVYPAKFDTTFPTLQQLGLDTLLKFAAASDVHYAVTGSQIIGNAQLSPNPTTSGATVTLEIEREAYVHIELFDLLGNKIGQTGFEGVFEAGTSATELNLNGLPPGSYFVRVSTANNEVQTLRLVKE